VSVLRLFVRYVMGRRDTLTMGPKAFRPLYLEAVCPLRLHDSIISISSASLGALLAFDHEIKHQSCTHLPFSTRRITHKAAARVQGRAVHQSMGGILNYTLRSWRRILRGFWCRTRRRSSPGAERRLCGPIGLTHRAAMRWAKFRSKLSGAKFPQGRNV
jgi:hypothetical protein